MEYSKELTTAFKLAKSLAKEYHHGKYGYQHLLKTSLNKDFELVQRLNYWGYDTTYLSDWADVRIQTYPKDSQVTEPDADNSIDKILAEAENVSVRTGASEIDLYALVSAIAKPGLVLTKEQLKTFPLVYEELLSREVKLEKDSPLPTTSSSSVERKLVGTKMLDRYCKDLTEQARNDKYDAIIGRDKEIQSIITSLGKRLKPNAMIVGEPGVGKTALLEGLAIQIAKDQVTGRLKSAQLFELDLSELVGGASYRGELEERFKKILEEVKQFDNAILFIDEIHRLFNPNQGNSLVDLLKPELSRGELTMIGATTSEEYARHIEKDDAFVRRFEKIQVDEPNQESAVTMIKAIMPKFEEHHGLKLGESVITEAVRLAKSYFKDKKLPDSAISLLDTTMSAFKIATEISVKHIQEARSEIEVAKGQEAKDNQEEISRLQKKLSGQLSPLIKARANVDIDTDLSEDDDGVSSLRGLLDEFEKIAIDLGNIVSNEDLAMMVSLKMGIPLGRINADEQERLLGLEEKIKTRLVGQDHILKPLADAIRSSRQLKDETKPKPIGSFFLLGPTGTGKTELAKSLADLFFNDENALIRFDMSEYREAHSVSTLLGAPSGYVGYEEGGVLTRKIRQKPYSVVLFDEIEKANPAIFDIFLQVMDDAIVTDKLGKKGDFSNAIILMTSNLNSEFIADSFDKDIVPTKDDLRNRMTSVFRTEFLARFDEILPFRPISNEMITRIFEVHLAKLKRLLVSKGITLELTQEALCHFATKDFNPHFGARHVHNSIRENLKNPISRFMLQEKIIENQTIKFLIDENNEEKFEIFHNINR